MTAVKKAYKEIEEELSSLCDTNDRIKQEEIRSRWLEEINHRDFDKVTTHTEESPHFLKFFIILMVC